MHDGNRGDHTKVRLTAGAVVAALLAFAFIGWGLWETAKYEREAYDHASEYAADTDKKIRQACLSLPPIYQKDCTNEYRHEQRNNERDERDLVAQRKSALWAYIMGTAAVIGMGLSVIGVFLVYATFKETKRTANVAWHIGMAQVRARLVLDTYSVTAPYGTLQGWRDSPQVFPLMLKNVGTTVAENISVQGNITCRIAGREFSSALSLNPESPQSIEGEKTERLQIVCNEPFKHAVAEHIGTLSGDWKTPFEATCEVRADDLFGGVDVIRFRVVGDFQALGQGAVNCWAEVDPASVGREQISKPTEPE